MGYIGLRIIIYSRKRKNIFLYIFIDYSYSGNIGWTTNSVNEEWQYIRQGVMGKM